MRRKFLVFGSPDIREPEIEEVVRTLRSGWIGTGPRVAKFEKLFAAYKECEHAAALNSCTAALHLSMLAIGLKPSDEVIVPAMTFTATASAVVNAGGVPVLVDCERDTMNMDPADVERKISKRTRAIIPVHFAGRPCNMRAIMGIARSHRLKVIEDCAHAIEAEYHGSKAGTIGDLGCFSFYVTKNITTAEGGMLITDNGDYSDRIKIMALHGMTEDAWRRFSDTGYVHYSVVSSGFKYNMTDLQASLGIHQIGRVDRLWKKREEMWNYYNDAFRSLPVWIPAAVEPGTRHAYHLYTLLLDIDKLRMTRDRFMRRMFRLNIGTGVHYSALHLHPYYRKAFGYRRGDFPNAEWISDRTVSLPLSAKLSPRDLRDVVSAVKSSLSTRP